MKKMRGIFLFVLALMILSTSLAQAGSALDRILKKGELVVGTSGNQPPLNATTKDGKIIGLDADLSRGMASGMGVNLKIVTMPFAELLPALEEGKVDMVLSGVTITPKRNLKVAFVGPYYVTGKSFLTTKETIAALKNADGIDKPEYTLVALSGSTSQQFAEKVLSKARLITTENYDEAVDMVIKGKADAMVADFHFCAVSAFRYRDKGLTTIETPFTYEPIGVAIPAGDPLLLNWVQNFLITLNSSGELKKMTERWFNDASWLKELP